LEIKWRFFLCNKNQFQEKLRKPLRKGERNMPEKCFYCVNEIEEKQHHYVTFLSSNNERDEILCDECYQEWLQGVKG
jgi:hypothetical protein